MKNELYYFITQSIRSKITAIVSSLAAVGLLLATPAVRSEAGKILLLASSLAIATTTVVNGQTLREAEDALEDYRVTTGLKRQRGLLWSPISQPETAVTGSRPPEPVSPVFDLRKIGEDRNAFPNVFILGAPGSGKTTLAEYLGILLKADKRYAVHPHAKPSDFKGFDRIFGGGRNIGSPDDEPVLWSEIESGSVVPTIAQVFVALHSLMQSRYQQYYKGTTEFTTIDVYFDEMPAIATELGKKFLAKYLPSLIMECRKVNIRLWFLSQAFQIRALGLEGISDLREGATVIRLGKLALNEAHTLANNKRIEASSLLSLRRENRPALVDDTPAFVPGYVEMKAAIDAFVQKAKQPTPVKPTRKRSSRKPLTTTN
jgi:energy-coupling factor transporter ATP-binding protein EcfA2